MAFVSSRVSSGCRHRPSGSGLRRLSRGFSLARCPSFDNLSPLPGPLYSGLPQSSPSLSWGDLRLSLLLSLLQRWVGFTAGAAILYLLSLSLSLSLSLLSRPWRSTLSLSVCLLSPISVCLHRDTHREQQSFSSALIRLLAMSGSLSHRSHAHLTTHYPRHAAANLSLSVSYRLEQPI